MEVRDLTRTLPREVDIPGLACRFCGTPIRYSFSDLGLSPLCQNVVRREDQNKPETFYPLHAFVCHECFLVQLDAYVDPDDIFREYAYFSSYSDSWLDHVRRYSEDMISRWKLSSSSQVVEVASNDGYALQYFVQAGIPALGIDPAANVAEAARARGVETRVEFFGTESAKKLLADGHAADLLFGKNVLAQVPDINDFVAGIRMALKDDGVVTIEFPHLMRLMAENQFDTIYHEHFSYFSFSTATRIFAAHDILLFDVEELPTHGGSIRIYGSPASGNRTLTDRAREMLEREDAAGFNRMEAYALFAEQVRETKRKLLIFLSELKREGKTIAGYGAPGKGNTLLNYCGIGTDFIDYTVDRNPYKQNTLLPGSRIPVFEPDRIFETRPDYVMILPWNLKSEIIEQMSDVRKWGGKFIVPIPEVAVL